jgi:hypothetical protein
MKKKEDKIIHAGIPGMRWGVRNSKGPSNVLGGKRLSFKEREQKRRDVTNKIVGVALKKVGTKKMSLVEREKKRKDTTKKVLIGGLAVIGALKLIDIGAGIGYALTHQ